MPVKNDCCADLGPATGPFRRVLWAVLVINASMFVIEMTAGVWGKSVALQADALDFLGDSATYAITLIVLGMSIRWRAAAAMVKGLTMGGFGIWVLGNTVYHMARGTLPDFAIMGSIGAMALLANVISAGLLYGYRQGDSNMRSVWLCSRNDAIANVLVLAAAGAVALTATAWPDLIVGALIAALELSAAYSIIRAALPTLRAARATVS